MVNPYSRSEVVKLLRRAADHTSVGQRSIELSAQIHQLADYLEQED